MREQLLDEKERSLALRAELLERNGNGNGKAQTVRISVRELQLWKRQAKAIGRTDEHLEKIGTILQVAKERKLDFVRIPESNFAVRLFDQDEFNQLAFKLMENIL